MAETSRVTQILNEAITRLKNGIKGNLSEVLDKVLDYSVNNHIDSRVKAKTIFVHLVGFSLNGGKSLGNFSDLVTIELRYYAEPRKDASLALNKILRSLYEGNKLLNTTSTGEYSWELEGYGEVDNSPCYVCILDNVRTRNFKSSTRIFEGG